MPTIPSLTAEVGRLSSSVSWWNTAILVMMIVAASAATGLVLTQWIAFKRAEALATVTEQLSGLKEAESKGQISAAGATAASAQKQAAESNKAAGEANERAGKANERAANLENENVILQEKLANRRLTKAQHDFLVNLLSKKRGTIIIESMGDSESGMYAADLLKTFTDAGWTNGGTFFPLGKIWIGLIVYQSDDPDSLTIAESLKAGGIPFSIGNEKREKATIMVGGKPPMF